MARFLTPYDLDEISGILVDREYPLPNELQSNFGTVNLFETETIDLDKVSPDLRIGIFVAPEVNAKPTTGRGYDTKVFYPGYWKDKSTVDFRNIRKRRPGQALSTPTTNGGKIAAMMQDHMDIMKAKRIRLLEWIAAEILITGGYTAVSELHPSITLDLEPNIATDAATLNGGNANRANLTASTYRGWDVITDNGGAGKRAWDQTGGTAAVSPIGDYEQMLEAMWEAPAKVYMSDNAWALFSADARFDTFVDNTKADLGSMQRDTSPRQATPEGLKLRGYVNGTPIYTYNAFYQATGDAIGVDTKYLDDGLVIMVPNSVYGSQNFGAIQHGGADFQASELFWNSWISDEDGKPWLQGQSAPLLLHNKINSTVCWKVM